MPAASSPSTPGSLNFDASIPPSRAANRITPTCNARRVIFSVNGSSPATTDANMIASMKSPAKRIQDPGYDCGTDDAGDVRPHGLHENEIRRIVRQCHLV